MCLNKYLVSCQTLHILHLKKLFGNVSIMCEKGPQEDGMISLKNKGILHFIYLFIILAGLSVCPFVSNKRQNG